MSTHHTLIQMCCIIIRKKPKGCVRKKNDRLVPIYILNALQQLVVVDGQRQGWIRLMDLLFNVDSTLGLAEERHRAGSRMKWAGDAKEKCTEPYKRLNGPNCRGLTQICPPTKTFVSNRGKSPSARSSSYTSKV